MYNSLPLPLKKPPSRVADPIEAADPQLEAVLKEVRRLCAAVAVYRRLVDRLLEEKAA